MERNVGVGEKSASHNIPKAFLFRTLAAGFVRPGQGGGSPAGCAKREGGTRAPDVVSVGAALPAD